MRNWLVAQYGEPAAFTSDTDARQALFEDVDVLLELEDYRYFYTWCSPGVNSFLNAQRTGGGAPVVVASAESPQRPVDPDDVEMGHDCTPK